MNAAPKKFARPTVSEAVCEVRFIPSPDSEWSPGRPAPLYQRLMGQFPNMEPINEAEVELTIGPAGPVPNVRMTNTRIKFLSDDKTRLVQVSDRLFSYNQVKYYDTWDAMKKEILGNWNVVCDVIRPIRLARIGVRYINKVPRTTKFPLVGDWLKPTDFIPASVLLSRTNFLSRVETRRSENELAIVTVSDAREDDLSFTMYDIDMAKINISIGDVRTIGDIVEGLHTDVERQFLEACTSNLIKYLNGKNLDET